MITNVITEKKLTNQPNLTVAVQNRNLTQTEIKTLFVQKNLSNVISILENFVYLHSNYIANTLLLGNFLS